MDKDPLFILRNITKDGSAVMSALYSIVLLLSVARLETYLRETRIPDQQMIDLGMLTT